MQVAMKAVLIYNQFAGRSGLREFRNQCGNSLQTIGIEAAHLDLNHLRLSELVRGLPLDQYHALLIAGGDGTIYEAVNGYLANPSEKKPPIGVIPVGTGNSFARDLGLESGNWQQAIRVIAEGKSKMVDLGRFEENGSSRHFANILGMGFVADVTKRAAGLKWMGNFAYTAATIQRMMSNRPVAATLRLDGQTLERECTFITVSNTRYTSNFLIAPQARFDDGKLDLLILKHMRRRDLLRNFPKVLNGSHLELPEVEVFRISEAEIITHPEVDLAPDGECTGSTPLKVSCVHRAVPFFYNAMAEF